MRKEGFDAITSGLLSRRFGNWVTLLLCLGWVALKRAVGFNGLPDIKPLWLNRFERPGEQKVRGSNLVDPSDLCEFQIEMSQHQTVSIRHLSCII